MSKSDRGALTRKHMEKSLKLSQRMSEKEYDMMKHPELYPDKAEQLNEFMETLE